jgi:rod shape-determining protein MreC
LGGSFKNLFYLTSSPIQKWLWGAGGSASEFFGAISEIENLKKENEELKRQNQELLAKNVSLEELKKENETLREVLNLGLKSEFKLKFAEVIGKEVAEDSLIINQGSKDDIVQGFPVITSQKVFLKDGISTSSPVITSQKVLVGRISEVYQNFSKVMLISSKKSSFDAQVFEKKAEGVIRGKGNLDLFFDLVPKNSEISPGDTVVSSALSRNFPEGLLVGKITEVKKSDLEPFQKAEINPFFDINSVENLFIITEF